MKALIGLLGLCMSLSGFAQTANNSSQSSSSTSAVGNQQAVTFVTPPETRSKQSIDSRSDQSINTTISGTSKNIVEYTGSYTMKNVPSVNGPNLTTSNDTCMGSSSGSANGAGFGVSFGSTWTDEHCKRLKMSRELWNKGMKAASLAMDCMDPSARVALEITGTKCPQSMTVEERRTNYGAEASGEGAPAVAPSFPPPVATASPVSSREGHITSVMEDPGTANLYNH